MSSVIERSSRIPEVYAFETKHDTIVPEMGFDYNAEVLERSLSPVLYNSESVSTFLETLQDMVASMTDAILPVRNMFFWSHGKYYNRHGR